MLTSRQVDLVQESFARMLPVAEDAAADFYRRLFDIAPAVRPMFVGDMDEQGRKLFLMLATIVDTLSDLERVLPIARALAVRHVGYGVRDEHYAAVGEALLATLADALGADLDDETDLAWRSAYAVLADCMIDAAHQAVPLC